MSKIITLRVTDDELSLLKQKAQNKGVTMSSLLKSSALSDREFTRIDKQEIYIHLNIVMDYARQLIRDYDDERAEAIIKEADKLWQSLS